VLHAVTAIIRRGATALAVAAPLATALPTSGAVAQTTGNETLPIKSRNIDVSREGATDAPRSEGDQAIADGWPLYRTERGQAAFNDTMATLAATDGPVPPAKAFKGCTALNCKLTLPALDEEGWIPAGRIWVSPTDYVLMVHSPRLRSGQTYRRRAERDMRYFVFHEFHNSTRNTDPFDTISAHRGSVFVSFYMSKQWTDAKGRNFVIVVQVAPHDVVSFHATDKGSAGPGIEVAKNVTDDLQPLQGLAGILVAAILKTAAPQLDVVNHGGNEGLPMLTQYKRRLELLRDQPGASQAIALPFVPASAQRMATANAELGNLIARRGASPVIPVAKRGIVPPKEVASSAAPAIRAATLDSDPEPVLLGPIRPATRPSLPRDPAPTMPALKPADLPPGIILAR
jgi:hypothetical protein